MNRGGMVQTDTVLQGHTGPCQIKVRVVLALHHLHNSRCWRCSMQAAELPQVLGGTCSASNLANCGRVDLAHDRRTLSTQCHLQPRTRTSRG
eukprot:6032241-Amphidinium_carterae.1